jgi:hypothetical protein
MSFQIGEIFLIIVQVSTFDNVYCKLYELEEHQFFVLKLVVQLTCSTLTSTLATITSLSLFVWFDST